MRTLRARAERPGNAIRLAEFTAADRPYDIAKVRSCPRRSTLSAAPIRVMRVRVVAAASSAVTSLIRESVTLLMKEIDDALLRPAARGIASG
jgi:hypothetical protein